MKRKSILFLVIGIIFTFAFGFVSAATCGGEVECQCGDTITSNTTLTSNLDCTEYYSSALLVGADNVVLDCQGRSILGPRAYEGIYWGGANNVTVKNCNISGFSVGLKMHGTSFDNITNNTLSNNDYGLYLSYSVNSSVSNNILDFNNNRALYVENSDTNEIINNSGSRGLYGFMLYNSDGNIFLNNSVNQNLERGFQLEDSSYNELEGNSFCLSFKLADILVFGISNNNLGSNIFDTFVDYGAGNINSFTKTSSCVVPDFIQGECEQAVAKNITLTEDLDSCFWDGLRAYADGITIDCDGHSITGQNSGDGIISDGHNGTNIKNCNISGFTSGVYFVNSSYGEIENNLLNLNDNGVYLDEDADHNSILDNNFTGNDYGTYLEYSDYNSLLDNNFTENSYGFYLDNANNNQIGRNYVSSNNYNFGESGSSCPLLYTWNGIGYTFISDMSTEGKLSLGKLYPDDYLKVDGNQLQPQDNKYNIQVTEEYDEISFIDQLKLITIDHSPDVDVFNGLTRADAHTIYTVSKNPSPIKFCEDALGNNCLSEVSAKDGIFTMHPVDNVTNMVTINLGNLSNSSEIKLIISYSWANGYLVPNYKKSVQLKDGSGNWVSILSDSDLTTRAALQKTYVLNLTSKFLSDDYSVRLILPIQAIDYIAVDTTPEQPVIINEYNPLSADLHYRGYSNFTTNITKMFFYNNQINQIFSSPSGNFTKYGDVLSLVNLTDDKYAIIGHGDEISLSYNYEEVPDGKERDFLMFEYAYYKPASLDSGKTVEPLPFQEMSKYPYPATENYPSDEDHLNYISEYNTRQISPQIYGGSLPSSINNTVFENTIIVNNNGFGLYLYDEMNTQLLNNNVSGEGTGIKIDSSTGTIVRGNNISVDYYPIYFESSTSNSIISNLLNATSPEYSAIFVNDQSEKNNILHNTIIGKSWISDYNGGNYYNDSYSGNSYYFADGTSAKNYYNITDTNSDGWADSGSDLPFNSSMHSGQILIEVNQGFTANSLAEGWSDGYFADGDWATGSSPSGSVAIAGFNFGVPENIINATFYVGVNLSVNSMIFPEDCWVNHYVTIRAYKDSNLTVVCEGSEGPVEMGVIMGSDQLNEIELNWTHYDTSPWTISGQDRHPAITNTPSVRSVSVSLVNPDDETTQKTPVSFIFTPQIGWENQELEYCNVSADSPRATEISSSEIGLLGLWHFNENLLDSSGNGNNGLAEGGEFSSDAKFGSSSYYFDSNSDINLGDNSVFTSIDNFTISAWVKIGAWRSYGSIFAFGSSGDEFLFNINGRYLNFYSYSGSGNARTSLSLNQWHHVVADREGNRVYLYLDGELDGEVVLSSSNPIEISGAMRNIGGDEGSESLNGYLDELALWNRSLSGEEISSLYKQKFKNSSNSINQDQNNTLSLSLLDGNYTWNIECTDDAGISGTSGTRSLVVSGVVSSNQNSETTLVQQSSSSGNPTFYPTNPNLNEGYNHILYTDWKIKFNVVNEAHTLTLNSVQNDTATVTVSSTPQTKTLHIGEEWKVELTGDNLYDVLVKLNSITGSAANITIQYLNNSIIGQENIVSKEIQNKKCNNNYQIYCLIIGIILILIILATIYKKSGKKIREYFFYRSITKQKRHHSFY